MRETTCIQTGTSSLNPDKNRALFFSMNHWYQKEKKPHVVLLSRRFERGKTFCQLEAKNSHGDPTPLEQEVWNDRSSASSMRMIYLKSLLRPFSICFFASFLIRSSTGSLFFFGTDLSVGVFFFGAFLL